MKATEVGLTKEGVANLVKLRLHERLGLGIHKILLKSDLGDLGLDSLDTTDFLMKLEEELDANLEKITVTLRIDLGAEEDRTSGITVRMVVEAIASDLRL